MSARNFAAWHLSLNIERDTIMQANKTRMLELLARKNSRFVIPVYQRVYSWRNQQLRELWDDMLNAAKRGSEHFIGTVFYNLDSQVQPSQNISLFDVIDGQQRMTTITIFLCALRDVLVKNPVTGIPSADEISKKYLTINIDGKEEPKLVLSRADEPTMNWLSALSPRPTNEEEFSKLINDSYNWFKARIDDAKTDIEQVFRGANLLSIIEVEMQKGDQPQTVFESLNSKGLPLAVPDLVRNLIIERSNKENASDIYSRYFAEIDDIYAQDDDGGSMFMHAIRTWLGGGLGMKDEQAIFDAFKSRIQNKDYANFEKAVRGLSQHCLTFHKRIQDGDESAIAEVKAWEDAKGRAERLRNDRKIFGD